MDLPFDGQLWYGVIFILIPLLAAYGLWKNKTWGLVVGFMFFLPQCINYVGKSFTYKFMAPISLGMSLASSDGYDSYFFNLFAIAVVVFLLAISKPKSKAPDPSFERDKLG